MSSMKDPFEKKVQEQFDREAQEIDAVLEESDVEHLSDSLKEDIFARLQKQIEEHESEKIYARLSEEDRQALELGKEIMRKQEEEKEQAEATKKVVRKKKRVKTYVALVAVLVMVLAMGVTGIGGKDNVISVVKNIIGGREIVRVNTDDENWKIEKEAEEEAYQEIEDMFGLYPVDLLNKPKELKYIEVDVNKELQVAEILYKYNGRNVVVFVSASYADSSFGIDVEDKVIEQYYYKEKQVSIETKVYETEKNKEQHCSAQFDYEGVKYFIVGAIEKENFEIVLNSLHFPEN